jgi:hypothetical protein
MTDTYWKDNTIHPRVISASEVTYADLYRPWSYWQGLPSSGDSPSLTVFNGGDTLHFTYRNEDYQYASHFCVRGDKIIYQSDAMILLGPIVFPRRAGGYFIPILDFPLQTSDPSHRNKETLNAALLEAGFISGVDFYFPV